MDESLMKVIKSLEGDMCVSHARPEGSFSVYEFAEVWRCSDSHARRMVREMVERNVLECAGKFNPGGTPIPPAVKISAVNMYKKTNVGCLVVEPKPPS